MSNRLISRRPSRAAFTLVELLVVIAIIGTLVALLIPAVQSARATARQTQCMNNLKQLGMAMVNYESSKQKLPGYVQLIKRGNNTWVGAVVNNGRIIVDNVVGAGNPPQAPDDAWNVSWATMLLPNLERQDIWDRLVDVNSNPTDGGELTIVPVDGFVCPADTDASSNVELSPLTYSANTGSWDRAQNGDFLRITDTSALKQGDTDDNGIFLNLAEYARPTPQKAPEMRMSKIHDGAAQTIMLSENLNKDYEPIGTGATAPRFTWFGGSNGTGIPQFGTEQQLGIVWVVNTNPEPGTNITNQERINRDADTSVAPASPWPPGQTQFARPASAHSGGVNVVYADGHTGFVREDIEYTVYQRLLTTNGKKCVDPVNWNNDGNATPIGIFRRAPVLTESDYQ